jgi:Flp pilus assembly protein TadG
VSSSNRPARAGREDGQVLAIFAVALISLVLLVGLVIDGGVAFLNRREAQNLADTASMAGAKIINNHYVDGTKPDGTGYTSGDVYAALRGNAETANGCLADGGVPCTWSANFVDAAESNLGPVTNSSAGIPFGTRGVVVSIVRQPRTYFLGVAGQTTWTVGAGATAVTARITATPPGQLLPIGTNPPQPFTPGQTYTLTEVESAGGGGSPGFGPGNFGWLSWTGTNDAGALATSLCSPDNPEFSMPYDFPGDPGASNSSGVRACLDGWITAGTTVLIPVVSGCDPCNGNLASFTVSGVAAFVLNGYTGSGPSINSLSGRFVEYYGLPTVPGGLGSAAPQPGDPTSFLGIIR